MGSSTSKPKDREGFQFRAHLAPDLHRFLKYDSADPRRRHIVTHIVSACFGVLKADYAEAEEERKAAGGPIAVLQAMAEMLKAHGLPHWSEADFSPELAATRLYPHRVGESSGDSGED